MASRLTPSAASGVTGAFIELSDFFTERPFLAEYCPPPRFSEGSQSRQQRLKFSTSATASAPGRLLNAYNQFPFRT